MSNNLILLVLLFCELALSTITCPTNQIPVIIIHSTNYDDEEWEIASENGQVLYQSWVHQEREEQREVCLPMTDNLIYYLYYDNAYYSSNLQIKGIYGNVVMNSVFCVNLCEFSLITPIKKNAEWKWTTNTEALWQMEHHEEWSDALPENYPETAQTHYFTIPFDGKTGMAAYEMKFYYKSGIVAYINGVEVYRDNLVSGIITNSTSASQSYSFYDYRGSIRNGVEVSSTSNVLGVEIHSKGMESIQFDGWLAIYSSSEDLIAGDNCYTIQPTSTRANDGYDLTNTADLNTISCITYNYITPNMHYVEYMYNTAQVNSFRTMLDASKQYFNQIKFTTKDMITNIYTDQVTTSVSAIKYEYHYLNFGNARSPNSKTARAYLMYMTGSPAWLCEMVPRVCAVEYEMTLTYPKFKDSYEYNYDSEVYIYPEDWEKFEACSITPALPSGLKFSKCSITGKAINAHELTTYTVYAHDEMGTKVITFELKINGKPEEDNPLSILIVIIIIIIIVIILLLVGMIFFFFLNKKNKKRELKIQSNTVIIETPQKGRDYHPSSRRGEDMNSSRSKPISIDGITIDSSVPSINSPEPSVVVIPSPENQVLHPVRPPPVQIHSQLSDLSNRPSSTTSSSTITSSHHDIYITTLSQSTTRLSNPANIRIPPTISTSTIIASTNTINPSMNGINTVSLLPPTPIPASRSYNQNTLKPPPIIHTISQSSNASIPIINGTNSNTTRSDQ